MIAPKFEQLAQGNHDVIFLKLNCNKENKPSVWNNTWLAAEIPVLVDSGMVKHKDDVPASSSDS